MILYFIYLLLIIYNQSFNEMRKKNIERAKKLILFLYFYILRTRHFRFFSVGQLGYIILMERWILGPSWIWTSVDMSPTNLQSVPINRSGIDPGRIHSRLIDNPWSTSFRSTLPPGEVESPLPPWKRDVLNH